MYVHIYTLYRLDLSLSLSIHIYIYINESRYESLEELERKLNTAIDSAEGLRGAQSAESKHASAEAIITSSSFIICSITIIIIINSSSIINTNDNNNNNDFSMNSMIVIIINIISLEHRVPFI